MYHLSSVKLGDGVRRRGRVVSTWVLGLYFPCRRSFDEIVKPTTDKTNQSRDTTWLTIYKIYSTDFYPLSRLRVHVTHLFEYPKTAPTPNPKQGGCLCVYMYAVRTVDTYARF